MRALRRAGSVALYLAGVLLFFEATSRAFLASDALFHRVASPVTDPSWRLQWERRHSPGAPFRYSYDVHHPSRGWTLKPDLRDPTAFGGRGLSSNSRGLRGRGEYRVPKPPGTLRILCFGDSFTFGEDVGDADTFSARLQAQLPGVEVLNFGVHGYGHDQMLLRLREEAAAFSPDIVLLGYVTDDALRNVLCFRDFAKPRFRIRDGRLLLTGVPVPDPEELLRGERYRSRFVDLVTMASQQAAWSWGGRRQEMYAVTMAILDAFFQEVRAQGAVPVVADLPVWRELENQDPALSSRERLLMQECSSRRVEYLPLRPRLVSEARYGLALETHEHWGVAEHRLAAEAIADFLASRDLLQRARPAPVEPHGAASARTSPSLSR